MVRCRVECSKKSLSKGSRRRQPTTQKHVIRILRSVLPEKFLKWQWLTTDNGKLFYKWWVNVLRKYCNISTPWNGCCCIRKMSKARLMMKIHQNLCRYFIAFAIKCMVTIWNNVFTLPSSSVFSVFIWWISIDRWSKSKSTHLSRSEFRSST